VKGVSEVRAVSGEHSPVQLIQLMRHYEAATAARMDSIAENKGHSGTGAAGGGGNKGIGAGAVVAPSLVGPRGTRARPRTGSDLQMLQGRGKLLLSKVRSVAETDLDSVVGRLLEAGYFVSRARPVATDMAPPPAAIRVVVTALHTEDEVRELVAGIRSAVRASEGAWQAVSGDGAGVAGDLGLVEDA